MKKLTELFKSFLNTEILNKKLKRKEILKHFSPMSPTWKNNKKPGSLEVIWRYDLRGGSHTEDATETLKECVQSFCDFASYEIIKYKKYEEENWMFYHFWVDREFENYDELDEIFKQFKDPKNKKYKPKM